MRAPPAELQQFLAAFAPEIGSLFLCTRRVVLAVAPDADELIYDAYNAVSAAYSYSGRLKEAFCHVAAYPRYVNLGFNRGAGLPDPTGILAGSGAQIRHVRISAERDLDAPAVRALLQAAAREGLALAGRSDHPPRSLVRPTTGGKRRPASGPRR